MNPSKVQLLTLQFSPMMISVHWHFRHQLVVNNDAHLTSWNYQVSKKNNIYFVIVPWGTYQNQIDYKCSQTFIPFVLVCKSLLFAKTNICYWIHPLWSCTTSTVILVAKEFAAWESHKAIYYHDHLISKTNSTQKLFSTHFRNETKNHVKCLQVDSGLFFSFLIFNMFVFAIHLI